LLSGILVLKDANFELETYSRALLTTQRRKGLE